MNSQANVNERFANERFHKLQEKLRDRVDYVKLEPIIANLSKHKPSFFAPALTVKADEALSALPISLQDLKDAEERLERWAPVLEKLFPELEEAEGLIESPLIKLDVLSTLLEDKVPSKETFGQAYIKADHALPVAGSIKARGGIYEVLVFAETVGISAGLMEEGGSPLPLISPKGKKLLSQYKVGVGSTGNLGFSIGVMAATLGFHATVHMSQEAKEWKKERLRQHGVRVVEHEGDFASAVHAGREELKDDPKAHFVDDENSQELFLGYAVAALRLKKQLAEASIEISPKAPLLVYLPCGVGGSPGGITWGLKVVFGEAVHCFFAEPVSSPAFLLRALIDEPCTVYDYGLENRTEADGLAVAQASELVYEYVKSLVSGYYTVTDDSLYHVLAKLKDVEDIKIEPSAAAGFLGPLQLYTHQKTDVEFLKGVDLSRAHHLIWTTGGLFVPSEEYEHFYQYGKGLLRR